MVIIGGQTGVLARQGHGACKTTNNACKGHNGCKGQGVAMQESEDACKSAQAAVKSP
jgi:hypothetical protein